jgi:hypothetical protein
MFKTEVEDISRKGFSNDEPLLIKFANSLWGPYKLRVAVSWRYEAKLKFLNNSGVQNSIEISEVVREIKYVDGWILSHHYEFILRQAYTHTHTHTHKDKTITNNLAYF